MACGFEVLRVGVKIVCGAEAADPLVSGGEVPVACQDVGHLRQELGWEMGDLAADFFEAESVEGG